MDSVLNRAITAHTEGRFDEAESLYRAVPEGADRAQALALLGVLLGARGRYAEGAPFLMQAVALDPDSALFRFYLGNVLSDAGRTAEATTAFEEALRRQPDFAEAHYRLALTLEKQARCDEAIPHLQQAAGLKSQVGEIWLALSDVARQVKDYTLADQAAAEAVRLMPDSVAAHIAQGLALDFLDREEEALASFAQAIHLKPHFIEAWDMLGTTYQQLNRLDEAETAMRKAIEVAGASLADEANRDVDEADYATQHWNLALLELLRGDFRNGFAHYRARFKKPGRKRLTVPQPLWRGEDLRDKKILLVGEQGFGDVLMFCRYAPLLKARGAKVVLLVHEALAPLLRAAPLADTILTEAPSQQGDFDFQASLFDLPHRLGTELATIPDIVPYLPSPPADATTILPDDNRPRIGIVWSGRRDFGNDRRRSLSPELFAPLLGKKRFQFFNLTRDLNPGDALFLAHHKITDLSPKLSDFLATAQIVAQLDLVIACDTGVAHLAAGMGKKTWILLPFAPDWRWLTERADSPWYPTARLFRQHRKADWAEVIARVGAALDTGL